MPSQDGHAPFEDEGPRPDPHYNFGVTTPYTTAGPGAAVFENDEMLPSAVDPYPGRGRAFQHGRKDSANSGAGSDSGSSNTNVARLPPQQVKPLRQRNLTLRPTMADTMSSNMTAMTERTLVQQEGHEDQGKMANHNTPPGAAEARMRRLLHELDSIGLTDDMTIGRPSVEIDDWAASSSMDHSLGPRAPVAPRRSGSMPPSRQQEVERMKQLAQSRNWAPDSMASHPIRVPYNQPPHRNYRYPEVPGSASPLSEGEDVPSFGGMRTGSNPLTAGPGFVSRQGSYRQSPTARGMQLVPSTYHPVQASPINSAAFPMPPRNAQPSQHTGHPPMVTRTPHRPGASGNDPPIAYHNNVGHGGMYRDRFGSDQNLRERYLASGTPAASSTSIASGSQSSQIGLSPISPASAPAMTLSSSGSRANSASSGALETPVEGATPIAPVSFYGSKISIPTATDAINEKRQVDLKPPKEIVITSSDNGEDKSIGTATVNSKRGYSPISAPRRGSLDSGLVLKTTLPIEHSHTKSPIVDLSYNNPNIAHSSLLGGDLSFGGVSFAVKGRGDANPPPYRLHSPPLSSGLVGGRSNSLRAGSIGGRSDGSASSLGDGTRKATPTVALATAFAKDGLIGLSAGPVLSKAEKAAEKARLKAERAAEKAEEARRKVEEERNAKLNAEEIKKKKKEEKMIKKLQAGEPGLYGLGGMWGLDT